MDLREKVKEIAEKGLGNPAHFLVDVLVSKHKPWKFTVIVDGDQGITIDDCSALSNAINDTLVDAIDDPYTLEVSTPGLDHPLKLNRQFKKNVGRNFKIVRKDKSVTTGILKETDEEKIVIESEVGQGKKAETKQTGILFTEIEKAFVTVSFK